MKKKHLPGYTLLEILIVVLLISTLAIGLILLLDPITLFSKGVDAQRKADLNTFKKKLEEFYNDKGCYPRTDEVCFSGGTNGDVTTKSACTVCGKEATSPLPYSERLPCDPKYPANSYLYAINTTEKACPRSYTIYATLGVPLDLDSIALGCGEGGCGPTNSFGYDYGVSSPNSAPRKTGFFICFTKDPYNPTCDWCGAYEDCVQSTNCNGIYTTDVACCASHRCSQGCPCP